MHWRSERLKRCLAALSLMALAGFAAGGGAPVASTGPDGPSPQAHGRAEETARIRTHHLKRTHERLTVEPAVLHENCRYESEIATPPPPGRVVLTFDDGPEPGETEYILETLKKYDIAGTFFVIGYKAKAHPELIAGIRAAGRHTIGNHSWDHPNFHDIDPAEQAGEILRNDEVALGSPAPKLFRYPYGNSSCEANALLRVHAYKIVGWHVDSCDWAFDRDGSVDDREALSCGVLAQNRRNFVEHVVSSVRAHGGGIVLLHEIHPNTLRQLDEIIVRLLHDGFSFADIHDAGFEPTLR